MEDIIHIIFDFIGTGNYIYISPVCKLWTKAYANNKNITTINNETTKKQFTYALKNGLNEDKKIINNLVIMNRLDLIKLCSRYFKDEIFSELCFLSAQKGDLDLLKWSNKMGYEWGDFTCDCLYMNGRYSMLKWAIDNGKYWNGSSLFCNLENKKIRNFL